MGFRSASEKFVCAVFILACALLAGRSHAQNHVLPGVEVLVTKHAAELKGKRVGILTNPTGVDRRLASTIDLVRALPGVKVVRLFAPEHGLRGGFYAGEKVDESRDPISGLPIASLYGKTRRPTPEMLRDLDVVLYDIQDVGVRHYTFVSSLTYLMEACEKAKVAVWVLDRPEPMGGIIVGGPMMHDSLQSFIGVHNVPLVYGMTSGEWAKMIKEERTPKLELKVIPLQGWSRGMQYGDLGWVWVPPSQHIPRWETCLFYAMTGTIGELGVVSEGVGVPLPFEIMGAPWMDGVAFADAMNSKDLKGVLFRPTSFTPRYGTHTGKGCQGVQIHLLNAKEVDPTRVQLELIAALNRLYPQRKLFSPGKDSLFLQALGDPELGKALVAGRDPHGEQERINGELKSFKERRKKYLMYD